MQALILMRSMARCRRGLAGELVSARGWYRWRWPAHPTWSGGRSRQPGRVRWHLGVIQNFRRRRHLPRRPDRFRGAEAASSPSTLTPMAWDISTRRVTSTLYSCGRGLAVTRAAVHHHRRGQERMAPMQMAGTGRDPGAPTGCADKLRRPGCWIRRRICRAPALAWAVDGGHGPGLFGLLTLNAGGPWLHRPRSGWFSPMAGGWVGFGHFRPAGQDLFSGVIRSLGVSPTLHMSSRRGFADGGHDFQAPYSIHPWLQSGFRSRFHPGRRESATRSGVEVIWLRAGISGAVRTPLFSTGRSGN